VKQSVLDNFQVDGSIPITHGQINDMVINLRNELLTAIDGRGHNNDPNPNPNPNPNPALGGIIVEGFRVWTWGGRLHPCPENFEFPLSNTKVLWDLWFNGRPCDNMSPFRFLKSDMDFSIKKMQVRFSKASFVMKGIIEGQNQTPRQIAELTIADRDRVFEESYMRMFHLIYPDKDLEFFDNHRVGDLKVSSMYDLIKAYEKRIL
jgi:hypothetical protein